MTGGFIITRLDEPDGELVILRIVVVNVLLVSPEDKTGICVQLSGLVVEIAGAGVGEGRVWTEGCGASEFATGI